MAHVTAVDPSAGMLAVLRRDAEQMDVTNVTTVQGTWEEAATQVADVVFSAFVLTLVPDGRRFVSKLDAAARDHVVLYLGAYSADAVLDPLWRHFHGAPRTPGPSYLDALAVLHELGIAPQVKVVEIPNRRRFATIEDVVEHYRDWLLLPDTTYVSRVLYRSPAVDRTTSRRSPRHPIQRARVGHAETPTGRVRRTGPARAL